MGDSFVSHFPHSLRPIYSERQNRHVIHILYIYHAEAKKYLGSLLFSMVVPIYTCVSLADSEDVYDDHDPRGNLKLDSDVYMRSSTHQCVNVPWSESCWGGFVSDGQRVSRV
jgi:hypothetical protein